MHDLNRSHPYRGGLFELIIELSTARMIHPLAILLRLIPIGEGEMTHLYSEFQVRISNWSGLPRSFTELAPNIIYGIMLCVQRLMKNFISDGSVAWVYSRLLLIVFIIYQVRYYRNINVGDEA